MFAFPSKPADGLVWMLSMKVRGAAQLVLWYMGMMEQNLLLRTVSGPALFSWFNQDLLQTSLVFIKGEKSVKESGIDASEGYSVELILYETLAKSQLGTFKQVA